MTLCNLIKDKTNLFSSICSDKQEKDEKSERKTLPIISNITKTIFSTNNLNESNQKVFINMCYRARCGTQCHQVFFLLYEICSGQFSRRVFSRTRCYYCSTYCYNSSSFWQRSFLLKSLATLFR